MLTEKLKVKSRRIGVEQTWKDPKTHYLNAIDDPWYQALFKLKADIVQAPAGTWLAQLNCPRSTTQ